MGSRLAIVLTMLAHLCRGQVTVSLKQKPAIQVILSRDYVTIYCNATFPLEHTDTKVTINTAENNIVNDSPVKKESRPGVGNTTVISYQFKFQPFRWLDMEPNIFYCSTTEASRRVIGTGTFIHARDTGYVAHSVVGERGLAVFLTTSCCILAGLNLAGTILLLLWKKKGYPTRSPGKAHPENGNQKVAVISISNRSEASTSGSVYSTLQQHSVDVYDTIEQDMKNQLQDSTPSSPVPSIPKPKPEIKKKPESVGKKKAADMVLSIPKSKPEIKKKPESVGKKKGADMVPSSPKSKPEIKKKPESVGKKKGADMKIQPVAAKGEVCDTVYENL